MKLMIEQVDFPGTPILFDQKWLVECDGKLGCAYMSMRELSALCYFASICDGNIVEIGCNEGYTTAPMAANNPDKIIYGIDCRQSDQLMVEEQRKECPKEVGRLAKDLPNVKIIDVNSSHLDYSMFDDVKMIFIDGGHHEEQVRTDSEKAIAHLSKNGGFILWHDYGRDMEWIDVADYLNSEILPHFPLVLIKDTSLALLRLDSPNKCNNKSSNQ